MSFNLQDLLGAVEVQTQEMSRGREYMDTKGAVGRWEITPVSYLDANKKRKYACQAGTHFMGEGGIVSCPKVTLGQDCKICNALNSALNDGTLTRESDEYIAYKAKKSFIWNVIHHDDPETVKFLRTTHAAHDELWQFMKTPEVLMGKVALVLLKKKVKRKRFSMYSAELGGPVEVDESLLMEGINPVPTIKMPEDDGYAKAILGTILEGYCPELIGSTFGSQAQLPAHSIVEGTIEEVPF